MTQGSLRDAHAGPLPSPGRLRAELPALAAIKVRQVAFGTSTVALAVRGRPEAPLVLRSSKATPPAFSTLADPRSSRRPMWAFRRTALALTRALPLSITIPSPPEREVEVASVAVELTEIAALLVGQDSVLVVGEPRRARVEWPTLSRPEDREELALSVRPDRRLAPVAADSRRSAPRRIRLE